MWRMDVRGRGLSGVVHEDAFFYQSAATTATPIPKAEEHAECADRHQNPPDDIEVNDIELDVHGECEYRTECDQEETCADAHSVLLSRHAVRTLTGVD